MVLKSEIGLLALALIGLYLCELGLLIGILLNWFIGVWEEGCGS
jgi:hypothetical protein